MMRKKSAKATLALIIFLCLCLSGCFEKSFENKPLSFIESNDLDVTAGESKSISYILPDYGVDTLLTASCDRDILSVSIIDDQLILTGNEPGECSITFTLSAKGYKAAQISKKVVVKKQVLFSVLINEKDIGEKISLNYSENSLLKIISAVDSADFKVKSADEKVLSITRTIDGWLITPNSIGCTVIEILVSADGYGDTMLYIPTEIIKTEAYLSLASDSVSVSTNQTAEIIFECQPNSIVTAYSDNDAVSSKIIENKILLTSNSAGDYKITVKCETENFITTEKSFTATFAKPNVSFIAPKNFELFSGETSAFSLAGYPSGTKFTVSSGAKLNASLQNGRIIVSAKAAGSDVISITAEKDGYQSTQVNIPVNIKAVTTEIKRQFESHINEVIKLVNIERSNRGLNILYILPELEQSTAIRAQEASEEWSHTRPDNREWHTSLYDTGVSFAMAGENLLEINTLDAREAVNAWMESPGHRENILRKNFVYTYIGIYKSGSTYWYCQHFIER